jgi:ABC-type branched-subunit amino acid transport system ATPase component/branched-subunit amino acid ABC-type transport system permease component
VSIALEFALLGLGLGGLYALTALGLIVVYRGSGTINFAQGAIGMVGTYFYWQFHDQYGWSFAEAFLLSVAISSAIGAIAYLAVMRPLRNSTPITRLLGTLGILITLQSAISLRFPQAVLYVTSSLPLRGVDILGATVSEAQLWLFGIAICLTAALGLVYRHTTFGIATTAVAHSRLIASTLGYSADRIACANWAIGAALAGMAGIFLAPITGLSVTEFTALLVPSLAAAVVGNMTNFPVTLLAGLVIGITESEMTQYISTPGWSEALPFFVVIGVLIIRGSSLPRRGEAAARLPAVGNGRIKPLSIAVAAVGVCAWIFAAPTSWVDATTVTVAIAIVLMSVVVVTGYAGQLSLCQLSLAGLGALFAGRLVGAWHMSFSLALLVALLLAIPVGVVVGLPSLRSRGSNLAIATLCLAVGLEALIFDSANLTGGAEGTNVGSPTLFGIDMNSISNPTGYALVTVVFAAIAGVLVANLRRSRSGRQFLAVRSNERAASALGIRVVRVKLRAFVLGSVLAALGGVLYSFMNNPVVYSSFDWLSSVNVTGLAVIGGVGYNAGPYFGAPLQPGALGTSIANLFGPTVETYLPLIGGVLLIVTVIQAPNGIAEKAAHQFAFLSRHVRRIVRRPESPERVATARDEAYRGARARAPQVSRSWGKSTLSVEDVHVSFGGTVAVDGAAFDVSGGEVLGIIGPNGAGKTTLIDAIMGFVPIRRGRIVLNGDDISRLRPEGRALLGIGMTFQLLELFEDMSVLENLFAAAEPSGRGQFYRDLIYPGRSVGTAEMWRIVDELGLWGELHRPVKELPDGRRRLVAVARAAARSPSVLLLDEPAAGLSGPEAAELRRALQLAARRGAAVVLIEHNVAFVMEICDRIVVLDFGKAIATGSPREVRANPLVVEAYLGEVSVSQGGRAPVKEGGGDVLGSQESGVAIPAAPRTKESAEDD